MLFRSGQAGDHHRIGPAHAVTAVGVDGLGDRDEDRAEPEREGQVAPPVDPRRVALARLAQPAVGPNGVPATWYQVPR